jgi:hypothetical protein
MNNFNLYTLFLSSIFLLSACSQIQDRCNCDPMQHLGSQTDSVRITENSGYDANGKIAADAEIKKIIDAGITISGNYKNYDETVKITVNKIIDKFPEITNLQKFELDFYCTYLHIICKDKSLDDNAFLKLKIVKLNSIHGLIQKLLLERIGSNVPLRTTKTDKPLKVKTNDIPQKVLSEQPNIQAKNINTGTNFGHVGDTYFSNEKELSDQDKIDLILEIDSLKKEYNLNPNCFSMITLSNSNGGKVSSQIKDFLINKGYKFEGSGIINDSGKGVSVRILGNYIKIIVGTL